MLLWVVGALPITGWGVEDDYFQLEMIDPTDSYVSFIQTTNQISTAALQHAAQKTRGAMRCLNIEDEHLLSILRSRQDRLIPFSIFFQRS